MTEITEQQAKAEAKAVPSKSQKEQKPSVVKTA